MSNTMILYGGAAAVAAGRSAFDCKNKNKPTPQKRRRRWRGWQEGWWHGLYLMSIVDHFSVGMMVFTEENLLTKKTKMTKKRDKWVETVTHSHTHTRAYTPHSTHTNTHQPLKIKNKRTNMGKWRFFFCFWNHYLPRRKWKWQIHEFANQFFLFGMFLCFSFL